MKHWIKSVIKGNVDRPSNGMVCALQSPSHLDGALCLGWELWLLHLPMSGSLWEPWSSPVTLLHQSKFGVAPQGQSENEDIEFYPHSIFWELFSGPGNVLPMCSQTRVIFCQPWMLIVLASKDAKTPSWPGCHKAAAVITIQTSQKLISEQWMMNLLWICENALRWRLKWIIIDLVTYR